MDKKRSSSLGVFLGGCVSGALALAFYWGTDASELSNKRTLARAVEPQLPAPDVVEGDCLESEDAPTSAGSTTVSAGMATGTRADEPDVADAGEPLVDVLAKLEADYRRGMDSPVRDEPIALSTAQQTAQPSEPPFDGAQQRRSDRELDARTPPLAPSTAVAIADAPEEPVATGPRALRTAANTTSRAEAEAPSPYESASSAVPPSNHTAIPHVGDALNRVNAQVEQLAALQQVATVQQIAVAQQLAVVQQFALLQYLQLLAPPPRARVTPAAQRRQPRIVHGSASSISATDNPWGFDFSPTVLVR